MRVFLFVTILAVVFLLPNVLEFLLWVRERWEIALIAWALAGAFGVVLRHTIGSDTSY